MKKEVVVLSVILLTLVLPYASASIFDWFKNARASPSQQTDVSVTVGNSVPTIVSVSQVTRGLSVGQVNLVESAVANVLFNFTVQDNNGAGDINDATAKARFRNASEPIRDSTGCVPVLIVGNQKTYQCTVPMQYYDKHSSWGVNVSVKDSSGSYATNLTRSFTVNALQGFSMDVSAVSFSGLVPGAVNSLANVNTTLNNTGNYVIPADGPLRIISVNLTGLTDASQYIPADNFRVVGSAGASTVCTAGTVLDDAATAGVSIANFNLGRGVTGNTDKLVYCLTSVPLVSSQTYTTGAQGWVITLQ